jgi:hypothetical protein
MNTIFEDHFMPREPGDRPDVIPAGATNFAFLGQFAEAPKDWNNRPRKCLGYKTPFEVFAKMTGKDYFLNGSVALMG